MNKVILAVLIGLVLLMSVPAFAMHIGEGFLPVDWAIGWWVMVIPFLIVGMKRLHRVMEVEPEKKMLLAMAGAFIFVLSALKIPSVTGSSSHLTGMGLGAILFGAYPMIPLGFIVLIFQALLLAHGGITTLGANAFSMAVVGPLIAYSLFRGLKFLRLSLWLRVFIGVALGSLSTYLVAAFQLALAHPDPVGGFVLSLTKFLSIFALTQIPLAIIEGLLTVIVYKTISKYFDNVGKRYA